MQYVMGVGGATPLMFAELNPVLALHFLGFYHWFLEEIYESFLALDINNRVCGLLASGYI